MNVDRQTLVSTLHNIATRFRIDSVVSTTEAGSGHPSTCCSAAEIVAALFFGEMRFDPRDPRRADNDRFVLSKGHAAPLLYSAWVETGLLERASLRSLRSIESDLEGHPVPKLQFVDVATGSLGQGLPVGVGIALNARRIGSDYRTYVLLGDGETAEGSVWEAANFAAHARLDNLCAITDVNALGQSRATMWGHDLEALAERWHAFGWETFIVDGHDLEELLDAFAGARRITGRPVMVLARTIKGKGISFMEGQEGWHGVPLKKGGDFERAMSELEAQLKPFPSEPPAAVLVRLPTGPPPRPLGPATGPLDPPAYRVGDKVATREAYGNALVRLGHADERVVALDADVKNSTYSQAFEKAFPERFYQAFIAEQAMVGIAMGLASRGNIAFPSTFACFLARACDFIRMTAISNLDVKFTGSHAGVSIGEDGPSQMGLEDLAMMRAEPNITVVYPSDAVSTERLVEAVAARPGPAYIRTTRPKTPVIYEPSEQFPIGGSKLLRSSASDRVAIVAAGITVFEALEAWKQLDAEGLPARVIDAYSIQPIDRATLIQAALDTGGRLITVEDHYSHGGLGDAVAEAVAATRAEVRRLAVTLIPQSGKPAELLDRHGISARHIVEAARQMALA
ncbi:MAG: transketolase [Vicinamibacterales bacterium]